jgi:hypothetical protein
VIGGAAHNFGVAPIKDEALKLDFDLRVMLQFRGSVVTSEPGLLGCRELDEHLG